MLQNCSFGGIANFSYNAIISVIYVWESLTYACHVCAVRFARPSTNKLVKVMAYAKYPSAEKYFKINLSKTYKQYVVILAFLLI